MTFQGGLNFLKIVIFQSCDFFIPFRPYLQKVSSRMISRQFFKSSLIYSVVGALPYASGFLLIPWFIGLLTPAQFGVNALYITLMYFIQILASWGFDVSVGILYFDYKETRQKLRDFLGTVLIVMMLTGFVTLLVFLSGGIWLFDLVFGGGKTFNLIPFGIFTVISGILNGIFKVYSNLLIYQQRPERFFWINLLNFAMTIGFSLSLIYSFPFTLYGPILGRMIPACISATLAIILLTSEYGISWNQKYAEKLIRYSAPIVIFILLGWVVNYIDRFLVLRVMGDTSLVGIYDFAIKLILAIDLVQIGLISNINPRIFSIWKEQNLHGSTPDVNRYYSSFAAVNLLIIPVFVLLAPLLIPLVIHKKIYFESFDYLAILGAGYATRVWYYMYLAPLLFFKKTQVLPKVFLFSALFQIVGSTGLIYFFGLAGAAFASFLIKPIQVFFIWLESRKIFSFKINVWKLIWSPVIYIGTVLCCELLLPTEFRIIGRLGQLVVAIILVFTTYRRELPLVLGRFSRRRGISD